MRRAKPVAHKRRIKTKKGYKTITVNPHIKRKRSYGYLPRPLTSKQQVEAEYKPLNSLNEDEYNYIMSKREPRLVSGQRRSVKIKVKRRRIRPKPRIVRIGSRHRIPFKIRPIPMDKYAVIRQAEEEGVLDGLERERDIQDRIRHAKNTW